MSLQCKGTPGPLGVPILGDQGRAGDTEQSPGWRLEGEAGRESLGRLSERGVQGRIRLEGQRKRRVSGLVNCIGRKRIGVGFGCQMQPGQAMCGEGWLAGGEPWEPWAHGLGGGV